jgi:TonB family protein
MKPKKQTTEEFVASLMPDSDRRLGGIAGFSLLVALALGFWATTYEVVINDMMFEKTSSLEIETKIDIADKKEEKKQEKKQDKKPKDIAKKNNRPGGGKPKNQGKPNAPKTRGVLKELASMTKNASASAYNLMNDQKFARDIDKILKNTNGLQTTGKTHIGVRAGKVDGAFNEEVASGGGGGIEGAFGNLFGGPGGGLNTKSLKGNMKTPSVRDIDLGAGSSSRSASDIMKVVRTRTPGLRHIYNKYLKKKPGLEGKVTLKFTIAPGGEVINIAVVSSATGHGEFDGEIKNAVGRWTFSKVKSGNTTVTIPFTFSE